jgi:hypothetical protein
VGLEDIGEVAERWLGKIEHRDKWIFCLNADLIPSNWSIFCEKNLG